MNRKMAGQPDRAGKTGWLLLVCFLGACALSTWAVWAMVTAQDAVIAETSKDNPTTANPTTAPPQSGNFADAADEATSDAADEATSKETPKRVAPKVKGKWVKISPQDDVWIDKVQKVVRVDGEVCNHRGQLEMFVCPKGTKEYESVVAVRSTAHMVHAGLLAIGAKSGQPVQFEPEYKAATGDRIDVTIVWVDQQGKQQQTRGQRWVRHFETKKELEYDWVFAGSLFWKDPDSGKSYYQAEVGDLICVSNFSTATMDLPVKSPQDNADLLYEAFTERLPPVGTPITMLLKVKAKPKMPRIPAEKDGATAK